MLSSPQCWRQVHRAHGKVLEFAGFGSDHLADRLTRLVTRLYPTTCDQCSGKGDEDTLILQFSTGLYIHS